MPRKIEKQIQSALARTERLNEVIDAVNRIQNLRVEFLDGLQVSQVIWADNNFVIQLPRDASGGGGVPSGFTEEELDVVEDDNTPGTRIFLTKAP